MKFITGVFVLLSLVITCPPSHAKEDDVDDNDDVVETEVSTGTNTSTYTGNYTNTGTRTGTSSQTTPKTKVTVACIKDDGKPANVSKDVCSAVLPKCSDLKTSYEKSVKHMLSWKIWGYYQYNKNLDLNKSTKEKPQGVDLIYPICSVVGHQLKYTQENPVLKGAYNACEKSRETHRKVMTQYGFETATQTIGLKKSCGARPDTSTGQAKTKLNLNYGSGKGDLWNSYLLGAMPWIIRAQAAKVFEELKPDFSNINDVITSEPLKNDLSLLNTQMESYFKDLASESKEACTTGNAEIVKKCETGQMTLTDPANRLCSLVKSQSTLNTGALPNMLVMEIMSRAQKKYDELFGTILVGKSRKFNDFMGSASHVEGGSARGKKACFASRLFDGANFYTFTDHSTNEDDCTGRGSRQATCPALTSIESGSLVEVKLPRSGLGGIAGLFDGVGKGDRTPAPDLSINLGFAGFVEALIRGEICGQKKYSDDSVCDKINIPDKPDDA